MTKVVYVSGTRADYGLMVPTLEAIDKCQTLDLEIIATGMHMMPEFGMTVGEMKNDGFMPLVLNAVYRSDTKESMARFAGECIQKLSVMMREIDPDIIMVLGDRAEMLAGAITGTYLSIPVAHIHGGDISSTVDEPVRHAITKLSHIHLAATKKSAERLIKMGEEPWRVHVVGSPAVDGIVHGRCTSAEELAAKFVLDESEPLLLVIQHPVSVEADRAADDFQETLEAIQELDLQTIIVFPNADAGGRAMIRTINEYKNNRHLRIFRSLARPDYVGLMKMAAVMVGNSSSGIIEAPALGLPVVNVGTRQEGRERSCNVIDVGYKKAQISAAVKQILANTEIKAKIIDCKNPYGDGGASERIVKVLSDTRINDELLQKHCAY